MSVNAAITQTPAPGVLLSSPPTAGADRPPFASGDLIRIDFEATRRVVFLQAPLPAHRAPGGSDGFWFQRAEPEPGWPPLRNAELLAAPLERDVAAVPAPLDVLSWNASRDADGVSQFELRVPRSQASPIRAGSWLRLTFVHALPASASAELLVQVASVRHAAVQPRSWQSPPGSPPMSPPMSPPTSPPMSPPSSPPGADDDATVLLATDAWWALDATHAWSETSTADYRAAVIDLELSLRDAEGAVTRLPALGLTPAHARYWGQMPTDRELFPAPGEKPVTIDATLRSDVGNPRFALAGPPAARESGVVYLPLGVPAITRQELYQSALDTPTAATAPTRNGLARFHADLFLDRALRDAPVSTLLVEAFAIQFPMEPKSKRRALGGMHALLPIDEVSLLAVPDAVHRGWIPGQAGGIDTLGAPELGEIVHATETQRSTLSWTQAFGATDYALEESEDPRFSRARVVWEGTSPTTDIERRTDCPRTLYYRVRARRTGVPGPWSNTRRIVLGAGAFEACTRVLPDPPELDLHRTATRRVRLEWRTPDEGADATLIEFAGDPSFAVPRALLTDKQPSTPGLHSVDAWALAGLPSYFRIAVCRGGVSSPWSRTAIALPAADAARSAELMPEADASETDLLAVHRAALRLCASRGDILAVLGVPSHFRDDAAIEYRERLATAMRAEDGDRTLSFGALYHPWPVSRDGARASASVLRGVPPDGAICGVIARRTFDGGAWLAPANRALRGVLALDPPLAADAPRRFYDAQVNLLRHEPSGFLVLAADTLSDSDELRSIGVRRLLIVLRRLALREGTAFVFEMNDEVLRRRVQGQFERLLADMFARGAFAGATRNEGFRVVADDSVNTPDSVERGRFIVELRVAPSQPLAFLTVRLVQSGGELVLAESA
jgi:hypothetical protein